MVPFSLSCLNSFFNLKEDRHYCSKGKGDIFLGCCLIWHPGGGGRSGRLCKSDGDGCRRIKIKPLRETNVGGAKVLTET